MPVKVPPSPSADEARDYVERIQAVRELGCKKKPTRRRWRDRQRKSSDDVLLSSKEPEPEKHKAKQEQPPSPIASRGARSRPHVAQHLISHTNADQPAKSAREQVSRADATAPASSEKSKEAHPKKKESVVRKPRLQVYSSQPTPINQGNTNQGRMTLVAIAAALAVSFVVNFAAQGLPTEFLKGIAGVTGRAFTGWMV